MKKQIPDKPVLLRLVRAQISIAAESARKAMEAAQESANSESKSSMGDKYETGRAMAQLDRDIYAKRYDQIVRELEVLERIGEKPAKSDHIKLGSLAETSAGWILLSVSLGVLEAGGHRILVVSGQSPLGRAVLGKKAGEGFVFQGKGHLIVSVN